MRFAQSAALHAGRSRRDLPGARDVLALVGLSGRARVRRRPHDLTPGERQRLALAVALANGPGLLLADEPTSQLDTRARDEVLAALVAVGQAGTTVVVVTHDPMVGAQMGRTVTIRDGRVGAEGRMGGADYSVVGRDGSLHLPPEVLQVFVPGSLVEVVLEADGTARLLPAGATAAAPPSRAAAPSPLRAAAVPPLSPPPAQRSPAFEPYHQPVPTFEPALREPPVFQNSYETPVRPERSVFDATPRAYDRRRRHQQHHRRRRHPGGERPESPTRRNATASPDSPPPLRRSSTTGARSKTWARRSWLTR